MYILRFIRRTRKAYGMFIYEACPAVLDKPFSPLGVGGFIFVTVFIYNNYVFFDGCHPLYCKLNNNAKLFWVMGAVPVHYKYIIVEVIVFVNSVCIVLDVLHIIKLVPMYLKRIDKIHTY